MSQEFKAGDLVRIISNPKEGQLNSHIKMKGLCGYIEEVTNDYAQFVELNEELVGGAGGVPLDCLELANDDQSLVSLKRRCGDHIDSLVKDALSYSNRYSMAFNEYASSASATHNVSEEVVKSIIKDFEKFMGDRGY